jgi:hypothetical protein
MPPGQHILHILGLSGEARPRREPLARCCPVSPTATHGTASKASFHPRQHPCDVLTCVQTPLWIARVLGRALSCGTNLSSYS